MPPHPTKKPLWVYINVLIALIIVNAFAWHFDSASAFHSSLLISLGFLLGMLALSFLGNLNRHT